MWVRGVKSHLSIVSMDNTTIDQNGSVQSRKLPTG